MEKYTQEEVNKWMNELSELKYVLDPIFVSIGKTNFDKISDVEIKSKAIEMNELFQERIVDYRRIAKLQHEIKIIIEEKFSIEKMPEKKLITYLKLISALREIFYLQYQKLDTERQVHIFDMILDTNEEGARDILAYLWQDLKGEIQKEKLLEIKKKFEDEPYKLVKKIWQYTTKEVQKENFTDFLDLRDNYSTVTLDKFVWRYSHEEVQKEYFSYMLNKFKNDFYSDMWENTCQSVQKEMLLEYLNFLKENDNYGEFKKTVSVTDNEIIVERFKEIYKIYTDNELSDRKYKIIENLSNKNKNFYKNIDFDLLSIDKIFETFTEEQLLRITNYPEIQTFIECSYENNCVRSCIEYLLKNDTNWIISLSKLIENESEYSDLIDELLSVEKNEITEEFTQQLISILSCHENYFEIKNYEDVNIFFYKRNEICKKILYGENVELPKYLESHYNGNALYKFALLQYHFGISLAEATRIVKVYGTDSKALPEGTLSDYLILLKEIIDCENIKDVVKEATEKEELSEPWTGFPSARNAEGKIINLFAELYNETLYKPKEEDKNSEKEIYIDKDEKMHEIDVYTINSDFNMNIRVEGAYRGFSEPDDFNKYYEIPDIDNHGNCESYIGNDSIAIARNQNRVIAGYSHIRKNQLTSVGPYDMATSNRNFYIYDESSEFRVPQEMINHTRHGHNEMVKDRLISDQDGNAIKSKPDFVVWIEEDSKDERQTESWKEKRENDPQWIMTKKMAAQLGIPIVIIDREKFAEREFDKIEVMKKMIKGEDVKEEKYQKYLEEYSKLSRAELIEQMIIKFENNRTGIQFNEKLKNKYFTQQQVEDFIFEIYESIKGLSKEEYKECLQKLINIFRKEYKEAENEDIMLFYKTLKQEKQTDFDNLILQNQKNNKEVFELMDKISNTHFYDGNKQHSIEHIHKVILFSELLAKGENLSEGDKKILLVAAAFHDSGRQGMDGNYDHAKPSAEIAGRELRKPNNVFDITMATEIAIIQTAIHYHEHFEKNPGQVDLKEIKRLSEIYAKENGLENIDLNRTIQICALLKDADALDRFRFAKRGKLKKEFLRSKTAKKNSVINYAKTVNEKVAEEILVNVYGMKRENISKGIEAGYYYNPVEELRERRVLESIFTGKNEPNIDLKKVYALEFSEKEYTDINKTLLQTYFCKGIDKTQTNLAQSEIKEVLDGKENKDKKDNQEVEY